MVKKSSANNYITEILAFQSELHLDMKMKYSTLNTARSASSSFVTVTGQHMLVGSHPLIRRFMKGVLIENLPNLATHKVGHEHGLSYLITLSPAHKLCLRDPTLKTCMLIALLSAQRQQTIHMLRTDN